jgi:hypothetical protein
MPVYKQPTSTYWLIEFWLGGQRYRRSAGTRAIGFSPGGLLRELEY